MWKVTRVMLLPTKEAAEYAVTVKPELRTLFFSKDQIYFQR